MRIDIGSYPIRTCGIYITRRCNLSCEHCSVRRSARHELGLTEWQRAFSILRKLGIETVSVLGGEPTLYEPIVELVRFNNEVTKLDLSIVSNSIVEPEMLRLLVDAGLQRYSTSVDTLKTEGFDPSSTTKSHRGMEALLAMQKLGVPHLTGYLVLRRENAQEVKSIARLLTDHGIWLYMLPFHTSPGEHWQTRGRNLERSFNCGDESLLREFGERMVELKSDGVLIANTVEYLKLLSRYAINIDWHCAPVISELRIDSDGVLMSCNDIRGENLSRFTIFSLEDESNLPLALEARAKDTKDCSGCFWPSHYHAQQLRYRETEEGWIWQK